MAEVVNIAEVANRVSSDIFGWFKWTKVPYMDENFECMKPEKHKKKITPKPKGGHEERQHSHPVDVVFGYFDPYLNKRILLNTDLKSYARGTITPSRVELALVSLSKTIDCARGSAEWRKKYNLEESSFEIRGMLFIYNHDNEYDRDFMGILEKVKPKKINIERDQIIHLIHPQVIRYLTTVIADMKHLHHKKEFPRDDYTFYYPDLYLHKHHGDYNNYPATIELLCSPFMIIKHGPVKVVENDTIVETSSGGYVIYYNKAGDSDYEFMYLFDSLSRFQMLSSGKTIKIRVAHHSPSSTIRNNYERAIEKYVSEWGNDDFKRKDLIRIDFDVIDIVVSQFRPGALAWRYE